MQHVTIHGFRNPQALTRKFSLGRDVQLEAIAAACPPQLTGKPVSDL